MNTRNDPKSRMRQDARVVRSKRRMRDALLHLMTERPLAEITVTQLCSEASVNRNTFYAHYASPSDVLDELMGELGARNAHALAVTRRRGSIAWLTELCANIRDERDAYSALLSTSEGRSYIEQEIASAYRLVMDSSAERIRSDPGHADVFAFATGGSMALIEHWLSEGAERSPEEMAILINRLCKQGMAGWFEGKA